MARAPILYQALLASLSVLALVVSPLQASLDDLPDPTRPGGRSQGEPHSGGELVLQSVLIAPNRRIAVINGQKLAVGDRIRDQEVIEIRTHEVVLRRAGHERVLRLLPRPLIDKSKGPKP